MEEIWEDIEGYESKYQVSNLGNVRSLNYRGTGKPKLLKQTTYEKGYKRVNLYKNGKKKHYWIHRLVAIAFIPNPNDLPVVNHKDEDPSNNNVNNLEWCTYEYNNNYGTVRKRISESLKGEKHPFYGKHHSEESKKKMSESRKGKCKGKDNPASKPILMYDREGNFIRKFECIVDAIDYFGKARNFGGINNCLSGRSKTACGYIFVYAEEKN